MGNLYSGGLNILVCYLYSGGLSLLCWAVFILLGCLCSGGPSVFWWAAYNLSLLSCGQSNEIVDYFFFNCVSTLCTAYFKMFVLLSYHVNPR